MASRTLPVWSLAVFILLEASISAAARPRIEAPCSACEAVAAELQHRIDNEPVRNHLDMRHRLDAQGQRYGKVIDYKVSELRVLELLEGLCREMKSWTLIVVNGTDGAKRRRWERSDKAEASTRPSKEEEEMRQKQLESYCGRVLEEYDEDLTEAIQKGVLDQNGVASWMCMGMMKVCPAKGSEEPRSSESSSTGDGGDNPSMGSEEPSDKQEL